LGKREPWHDRLKYQVRKKPLRLAPGARSRGTARKFAFERKGARSLPRNRRLAVAGTLADLAERGIRTAGYPFGCLNLGWSWNSWSGKRPNGAS